MAFIAKIAFEHNRSHVKQLVCTAKAHHSKGMNIFQNEEDKTGRGALHKISRVQRLPYLTGPQVKPVQRCLRHSDTEQRGLRSI